MVCTEVPNQIKFVSRHHPNDFIYTDFDAPYHGPALCRIARDDTYSLLSRRIYNEIRKYFGVWIRYLDGIDWWKKTEVENLVTLSLYMKLLSLRNNRLRSIKIFSVWVQIPWKFPSSKKIIILPPWSGSSLSNVNYWYLQPMIFKCQRVFFSTSHKETIQIVL
jgi:hypothetical protein